MSAGKAIARPKASQLNAAIRDLHLAHAAAICLERAATHEFIVIDVAADAAAAVVLLIERALNDLDQLSASAFAS